MKFFSRISSANKLDELILELMKDSEKEYDLGILFIAQHPYPNIQKLIAGINGTIKIKNLLGCTCAGIIGSTQEIERRPAVSLILAKLPNVNILPFSMTQNQLENLNTQQDWYHFFNLSASEKPIFITLPDPFLFDMNQFFSGLKKAFPGQPVIGGLASAAMQSHGNTLIVDDELFHEGVVGIVLSGDIQVETVVSQGCRPIGETHIVTKAEGNIIKTIAGKTFLESLRETFEQTTDRDKILAQEAIFIGLAMDEYKHHYRRGDFLIRMVLQIDPSTGAGIIGDQIKTGQTVQFHVRDAQTATEDLNVLLKMQQITSPTIKPKGALVFSCNGRGEQLFKEKNHDMTIIQNQIGPLPAAGFFCAGEIGPIGGQNFLHGFTASIALFYPLKSNPTPTS